MKLSSFQDLNFVGSILMIVQHWIFVGAVSYISLHSFPHQDPHLRGLGVPQQGPCQDPADLAKEMSDNRYTRVVVPSVQDKTRVSYVMDAIINFLIMKSYQRHQNLWTIVCRLLLPF